MAIYFLYFWFLLLIATIAAIIFQFKYRWVICKVAGGVTTGLFLIVLFMPGNNAAQHSTSKSSKARSAEDLAREAETEREKQIERQFSAWDGSHRKLEILIKSAMHNPASYEHVKTVYRQSKDHLVVSTTYRGTNTFGAIVTNRVIAKANISDGEIFEILDQQ